MSGSLPPYAPEFFAPASRCPRCSSAIAPSQNLPLVSGLLFFGGPLLDWYGSFFSF